LVQSLVFKKLKFIICFAESLKMRKFCYNICFRLCFGF